MKKTILAVALVVFFVMALAVPAFAQSMTHTKTAEIDGTIDWELQAGHLCNTGAELKSTIQGSGQLSKSMTTAQVRGKLTVSDVNDFVAGATNLSIISTIELCAPAKHEVSTTEYVYYDGTRWYTRTTDSIPSAFAGYNADWGADALSLLEQAQMAHPESAGALGAMTTAQFMAAIGAAHPEGGFTVTEWEPLTKQIWAVHVNADPGFSGNLHQDFEAAYGPYGGVLADFEDTVPAGQAGSWFYQPGATGAMGVTRGDNYVGNYFNIEQHARTSMGAVQRFIDISSPFSHAYVMEDMTAVGKSEINEAFAMSNLGPGADVLGLWWDLF